MNSVNTEDLIGASAFTELDFTISEVCKTSPEVVESTQEKNSVNNILELTWNLLLSYATMLIPPSYTKAYEVKA